MLIYVLMGLSLTLVGIAGLQFFYLFYLEQMGKQQKNRIRELEKHSSKLSNQLRDAEIQINTQQEFIDLASLEPDEEDDEVWADVIDER